MAQPNPEDSQQPLHSPIPFPAADFISPDCPLPGHKQRSDDLEDGPCAPADDFNLIGSSDSRYKDSVAANYSIQQSPTMLAPRPRPMSTRRSCCESRKVEDRLIRAGKKYTEKRKRQQRESELKKQSEEALIINSNIHSGVLTKRSPEEVPIGNRLYEYREKYQNRKEELKARYDEQELQELKPPEINRRSQVLASAINVYILRRAKL